MSSSPSRAPVQSAINKNFSCEPQPFLYDSVSTDSRNILTPFDNISHEATDRSVAEALARESQAREQGRQEGLNEARKTFDEQLSTERSSIAETLAGFMRDRADYFEKVEAEVVQLALAIARKILHREAQVDPLLLAGVVRVALEKIDGATGVVLRVHPQNAPDWRAYLNARLDPADWPQIVEDLSQPVDSCVLETSMGTAAIGLDLQLKEIEQGFMDLLAARSGTPS